VVKAVDFGSDGELGVLLTKPIQNVGDAVVRFAEVRSALSAWPRCPHFEELTHTDGTEVRYCAADVAEALSPATSPSWWAADGCPEVGSTG
jgi:hypothetical protein